MNRTSTKCNGGELEKEENKSISQSHAKHINSRTRMLIMALNTRWGDKVNNSAVLLLKYRQVAGHNIRHDDIYCSGT
jgi:hypothetical protein